jgi:hypothetical protein
MAKWLAFGDESELTGVYICAAVIVDDDTAEEIREIMRTLRPFRGKLRWHDESPQSRRKIIAILAGLDVMYVVAVRACAQHEPIARRRAKCLAALVAELDAAGVEHLLLESRSAAQDNQDLRLIARMQASRRLPNNLRVDHARGAAEPLLWIADVVAGAFGTAVRGIADDFEEIAEAVQVIHA